MRVELGTTHVKGRHDDPLARPVVTYISVPNNYTFDKQLDVAAWKAHVVEAVATNDGVCNWEGGEALQTVCHPTMGAFSGVAVGKPSWVVADDPDLQRQISEYYGCPEGYPNFFTDTHWRRAGPRTLAPGEIFDGGTKSLLTNIGATLVANNVGGGQPGFTGTATATSSTSLTTGAVTSVTANQYAGYRIYMPTAFANIISHTSGTTPVFTIDQWYTYATPGGAAASTPSSTSTYVIADGGAVSAWFMGITTTNITPAATDTSLSGEATANGMGRKIAAFTVTSAASGSSITFTVSTTFTYSGSGAATFYALALFNSNVKADTTETMFWETLFSGSFTVQNSGDTATCTDTISAS